MLGGGFIECMMENYMTWDFAGGSGGERQECLLYDT
jgi:hypothetical protein